MACRLTLALCVSVALLVAACGSSQDPDAALTVTADCLEYPNAHTTLATRDVCVVYGNVTIRAPRIVYTQSNRTAVLDGPATITLGGR